MFRAGDDRFVIGNKENLTENMEAFSLKVIISVRFFYWFSTIFFVWNFFEKFRHHFFLLPMQFPHVFVQICKSHLFFCAGIIRANLFSRQLDCLSVLKKKLMTVKRYLFFVSKNIHMWFVTSFSIFSDPTFYLS